MAYELSDSFLYGTPENNEAQPSAGRKPSSSIDSFVTKYAPLANRLGEETGNDPSLYLAQWGLETGWGKSIIPGTHNLGNIKDFSGRGTSATDNMTGSRDKYRVYDSPDAFGDDFKGLLSRRYKDAIGVGNDPVAYAEALKRHGYAEDPNYVQKISAAHKMIAGKVPQGRESAASEFSREFNKPKEDWRNMDGDSALFAMERESATPITTGTYAPENPEQKKGIQYGKELSAAIDSWQSNLWAIPAAMGSDYALKAMEENKSAAEQQWAESGAPQSFKEMEFGKNFGEYFAHMAIQSAPYMAEFMASGFGIGSLAKGALANTAKGVAEKAVTEAVKHGAAPAAAKAAGEEAGKVFAAKVATASGVAGSYPSAVGDVLSNQYEEKKEFNLPAAAALGVPYAALNAVGGEGMLMRAAVRGLPKSAITKEGVAGFAGRAGVTGLEAAGLEGASETGQEVMNQLGRMAVNQEATLTDKRAVEAYEESFIAGGLLGFAGGAATGGFRSPAEIEALKKPVKQKDSPLTSAVNTISNESAKAGSADTDAMDANLAAVNKQIVEKTAAYDALINAGGGKDKIEAANILRSEIEDLLNKRQEIGFNLASLSHSKQDPNDPAVQQSKANDPLAADVSVIDARMNDRALYESIRKHPNLGQSAVSDIAAAYKVATNYRLDVRQRKDAVDRLNKFFAALDNSPNFTVGGSGPAKSTAVVPASGGGNSVGPVDPSAGSIDGESSVVNDPLSLPGSPAEIGSSAAIGMTPKQLAYTELQQRAQSEYESAYQDLVKADQLGATVEERSIAAKNLYDAEQRLKQITAEIENNRKADTAQKRNGLLLNLLSNLPEGQNPLRAFDRALKKEGFTDTNFTEQEKETIARWAAFNNIPQEEFARMVSEPIDETVSGNGIDSLVPERKEPAKQDPKKSFAHIDAAIARKFKFNGKALTNPKTGKARLLKPDELAYYKDRVANQQPVSQQAIQPRQPVSHLVKQDAPIAQELAVQVEPATQPVQSIEEPVQPEPVNSVSDAGESQPVSQQVWSDNAPKRKKPLSQWTAEEIQARLDRGGLNPESKAELEALLEPLVADKKAKEERAEAQKVALQKARENRALFKIVPDRRHPNETSSVTVKEGVAYIDGMEALDETSGKEIHIPEGLDARAVADILIDAGAITKDSASDVRRKKNLDEIKSKYKRENNINKVEGLLSAGAITNDLLKSGLDADSMQFRSLEYSEQAWSDEFGKDQILDTPIGKVKIGNGQHDKAQARQRTDEFGLIRPTLESPSLVIELLNPKEGADRQTSMLFVKAFTKPDGTKYFTSITVLQGGIEVAVSSHFKRVNQIGSQVRSGALRYSATAFTNAVTSGQLSNPAAIQQPNGASDSSVVNKNQDGNSELDALKAEMGQAIGELASILGVKNNLTPEEETQIIPVMSKIFRIAAKMGYVKFKDAARFVMKQIRSIAGDEVADKIEIKNLQAAYVNLNGFSAAQEIGEFDSIESLMAGDISAKIEKAEQETAENPTDAQKEAGNYAKGKFPWNGLTISIETAKGSERTGKDADGEVWSVTMPASYGYFLGTTAADNEHLDVFIGQNPDNDRVFVINQTMPGDSAFDEHKVVIGEDSAEEAKQLYLKSFTGDFGNKVFGSIAGPFSVSEFKDLIPQLEKKKPVTENVADENKSIEQLQKELESAQFGERSELNTLLIDRVTDDAEKAIENGEMPVYSTGQGTFVAIHPSAQNDGMIQVSRYSDRGVFGDSQYKNVNEAVRDNGLWFKKRQSEDGASALLENSLKAEAAYQESKRVRNENKSKQPEARWFESKAKAISYLDSYDYVPRGDEFRRENSQIATIRENSIGQGGVSIELSMFSGEIEDKIKKAAELAGKTQIETHRLYQRTIDNHGVEEANRLLDGAIRLRESEGGAATVNGENEQKPLATFEEGKSALRIIGDPAFIKERLDAVGIKSVPRKDGVNVTDKKRWDEAKNVVPVAIESRTIDGVPARLADVTLETMNDGSVRLLSSAETGNYASIDDAVSKYRESYKDSPEAVEQPAEEVEIPASLENKPVHIEDGVVEAATPAVIEKSLNKSAAMTSSQLKEAQKWLEGEIDKAMVNALDGFSKDYKGDMENMPFSVFDVPGDGSFKIPTFKGNLSRFKDRIKTGVFVVGKTIREQKVSPASRTTGTGTESTIGDFLEDGDLLTALEFSKQIGKPMVFGWNNPTKQDHPVGYYEVRKFDVEGFEDFNFVSARDFEQKSIPWAVIDLASGLSIRAGYSSRKDAENAARAALAKNEERPEKTITPEKIHKLIADSFARNEAGTQEDLESKWVAWAEKKEDERDGKKEALKEAAKPELQRDNEALDKDIANGVAKANAQWHYAGTGAGGVIQQKRIVEFEGKPVEAVMWDTAGRYNDGYVTYNGKTVFTARDTNNGAQEQIDNFIKSRYISQETIDNKGFERFNVNSNGAFELRDGNMIVRVEPTENGKYQASFRGAKSSPHLQGVQGAVDWADAYRAESIRTEEKSAGNSTKEYPFETGDGKYWAADGKSELAADWFGVAQAKSGTFFYLGRDNGERSFIALQAKNYDDAVKEAEPLDRVSGNLENYIKIAADSIKQLRKVDVERVLSQGNVPKKLVANFIIGNRPDLKEEVEDVLSEQDKSKYDAAAAEFKAKQAERAIVPLSEITVTLKARIAETGQMAEYEEKADVALKEIDNKIDIARSLIKCLAS
jgi:hypothetical protein